MLFYAICYVDVIGTYLKHLGIRELKIVATKMEQGTLCKLGDILTSDSAWFIF